MMYATPSLYLKEMDIRNLRCHKQLAWSCAPGVNLIYGNNGCGKSTLLEAIYMMVFGRSFRQAQLPEIVKWQTKEFHIQANWQRYGPVHIHMHGKGKKTYTSMQGKRLRNKEGVRNSLDVILDAAQGRQVILANPSERRKWLDQSILRCRESMLLHYKSYYRALLQRNRLQRRHNSSDDMQAWHSQMILHGQKIIHIRRQFIKDMNAGLDAEQDFLNHSLQLSLPETACDEEQWLQRLDQHQRTSGPIRFGPHCDKLKILFDGQEIRRTASSGQQKLASIAIRLVQQQLHGQHRGIHPVLILDDGLESLDQKRQQHLLERLVQNNTQIFISAPTKKAMHGIATYELSNGEFICQHAPKSGTVEVAA
ncbi:MAG: DNA replication and repair protein RecF [Mariprofundaceae bacterium]|nr:DNA replication and repair protein RecF [Mariprofundaceae bacterium]